jgi:hypothetical protein
MLINGPASGQPGRDAETFRPATLRPSDERSFCQAELDAEAFRTAPIGLPDGQKAGSPAGAMAPASALSSAIPGSVPQRQGLHTVGVTPPAVEEQNRDSAHIAGHDSDRTSGRGHVSQYPTLPPWTVQSPARSSLCDGSSVDGQGDCQPASPEPPAAAPAVTEDWARDYRRPSSVLRLPFQASSLSSLCCGRVEDRPLPTTTRDMIIPVLLAFSTNASALQIRSATTRTVDLRNARLSRIPHLRSVPSAGKSMRLTVQAVRRPFPLLLLLVYVPFLVAKMSSTKL